MAKCDFCGKEVAYPYKCRYCGGIFCEDHRLPPNHNCINIDLWRMREPPSPSGSPSGGKGILISEPYVVRWTNSRRRSRIKVDKKVALVVILLALAGLVYYAHASGYYNLNNLKEPVTNLQSSFNVPSIEQFKTESNPKEAYLKSYPVKVWYDVKPKVLKYWWGGKEKVIAVYIHFKNEGSKKVSFIVHPSWVYVIDEKEDNEYIGNINATTNKLVLHPNEIKTAEVYFYDLPKRGWLYFNIIYTDITEVHLDHNTSYKELGTFKGSEDVKLYFELSPSDSDGTAG